MKISFITTVFNEEKNTDLLLDSLCKQSLKPDEAIIVDGGSTDNTSKIIREFITNNLKSGIKFKFIKKKGNRSIGRNTAIKNASGGLIVCSDAGNILDKNWVKNITIPFKDKKVEVVAGYYKGFAKTPFEKCIVPYALVMPDRLNKKNFLPATRSIAFYKTVWKKVGGFNEKYSHNEDYIFANKLKEMGFRIVFAENAIVNWIPRKNFKEACTMFYRFALGDAEAGIIRPKVLLILFRYILFIGLLIFSLPSEKVLMLLFDLILILFYIVWSITKNYRYVNDFKAIYILPALQISSDIAIISGTIIGLIRPKQ